MTVFTIFSCKRTNCKEMKQKFLRVGRSNSNIFGLWIKVVAEVLLIMMMVMMRVVVAVVVMIMTTESIRWVFHCTGRNSQHLRNSVANRLHL